MLKPRTSWTLWFCSTMNSERFSDHLSSEMWSPTKGAAQVLCKWPDTSYCCLCTRELLAHSHLQAQKQASTLTGSSLATRGARAKSFTTRSRTVENRSTKYKVTRGRAQCFPRAKHWHMLLIVRRLRPRRSGHPISCKASRSHQHTACAGRRSLATRPLGVSR